MSPPRSIRPRRISLPTLCILSRVKKDVSGVLFSLARIFCRKLMVVSRPIILKGDLHPSESFFSCPVCEPLHCKREMSGIHSFQDALGLTMWFWLAICQMHMGKMIGAKSKKVFYVCTHITICLTYSSLFLREKGKPEND